MLGYRRSNSDSATLPTKPVHPMSRMFLWSNVAATSSSGTAAARLPFLPFELTGSPAGSDHVRDEDRRVVHHGDLGAASGGRAPHGDRLRQRVGGLPAEQLRHRGVVGADADDAPHLLAP